MPAPLINPPWDRLDDAWAVVGGSAKRYRVDAFAGPLSLKTVLRGSAEFRTPQGRFVVRPGQAVVLNAGSPYSMHIDSADPVTTLSVFLPRGVLGRAVATSAEAIFDAAPADDPLLIERACALSPPLSAALGRLDRWRASPERDDGDGETAMLDACAAWASLAREEHEGTNRCSGRSWTHRFEIHRRLCAAFDYAHAHYAEDLTVATLAAVACISPFHFQRLFRQRFGQTPMAAVRARRLQRARDLLCGDAMPVHAVARAVGFRSAASFAHLYRQRYGQKPSDERRSKPQF